MSGYTVRQYTGGDIDVCVPGSKSITNRALILAALSSGKCTLTGVLFSDDTRALVSCLSDLGFRLETDERAKRISVYGTGGNVPNRRAHINVRSAGTAARFITVLLAFVGGEYTVCSSAQMEKRPMQPLLSELEKAGVRFEYLKERGHFPFLLRSEGVKVRKMSVDTAVSSQFASALMLAASVCPQGLQVCPTGVRTAGSYIRITERMLGQFGVVFEKDGEGYRIPAQRYSLSEYAVEPDFSGADYFFAMGALLGVRATVRGLSLDSVQGDKKFLTVLEKMGATVSQDENGVCVAGGGLVGVDVDMQDFSDQALTLCALAPFASSPTTIRGIGHIRYQECDRIAAASCALRRMGVRVEERADGLTVYPAQEILPTEIDCFGDHRVAMSFAVAGMKCGNLTIGDPLCTQKTFENFFDLINGLYTKGESMKTLKMAVVGKDVSKSLSPKMHRFIIPRLGASCSYECVSIPEERFAEVAPTLFGRFDAFNITIPYKLAIQTYLNGVKGDAEVFGSVNTVDVPTKTGYNTDGMGFMLLLENAGVAVGGKSVLVLGTGGVGRSVIKKLLDGGANVFAFDLHRESMATVHGEFPEFTPLDRIENRAYDVIVNCTGVGMHRTEGVSPVGIELLSLCGVAIDLIYEPAKSEFLRLAESAGKKIVNGESMLFYQAYYSDCIYLQREPNAQEAKALFEKYKEEA